MRFSIIRHFIWVGHKSLLAFVLALCGVLFFFGSRMTSPSLSFLCNIVSIVLLSFSIVYEELFWHKNKLLSRSKSLVWVERIVSALFLVILGFAFSADMHSKPIKSAHFVVTGINLYFMLLVLFFLLKNHVMLLYQLHIKPFIKR